MLVAGAMTTRPDAPTLNVVEERTIPGPPRVSVVPGAMTSSPVGFRVMGSGRPGSVIVVGMGPNGMFVLVAGETTTRPDDPILRLVEEITIPGPPTESVVPGATTTPPVGSAVIIDGPTVITGGETGVPGRDGSLAVGVGSGLGLGLGFESSFVGVVVALGMAVGGRFPGAGGVPAGPSVCVCCGASVVVLRNMETVCSATGGSKRPYWS